MKRQPLSACPESLDPEQRSRIRLWAASRWPFLKSCQLAEEWERCKDWHLANGILRACWEATFRNWLRKAAEIQSSHYPASHASRATPQAELEPILRLIRPDQ